MIGTFSEKSFKKRNCYEIADADALARLLHAERKAVNALLANNNPERFPVLYENLTYPVREYVY